MKKILFLATLLMVFMMMPLAGATFYENVTLFLNASDSAGCFVCCCPASCGAGFSLTGNCFAGYYKFFNVTIPSNAVITSAYLNVWHVATYQPFYSNTTLPTAVVYNTNQSWVESDVGLVNILATTNNGTAEDSQWLTAYIYPEMLSWNVLNSVRIAHDAGAQNISYLFGTTTFTPTQYAILGMSGSSYPPQLEIHYTVPLPRTVGSTVAEIGEGLGNFFDSLGSPLAMLLLLLGLIAGVLTIIYAIVWVIGRIK